MWDEAKDCRGCRRQAVSPAVRKILSLLFGPRGVNIQGYDSTKGQSERCRPCVGTVTTIEDFQENRAGIWMHRQELCSLQERKVTCFRSQALVVGVGLGSSRGLWALPGQ